MLAWPASTTFAVISRCVPSRLYTIHSHLCINKKRDPVHLCPPPKSPVPEGVDTEKVKSRDNATQITGGGDTSRSSGP